MPVRRIKNICLKSALRQPVRMAVLLLLIAAVGVACFSQLLQYAMLSRAVGQISGYYRAIGSLISEDPETEYDISGCMDTLENSRYVDFVDERRLVNYTLEGMYNANIYSRSDLYVTATVESAAVETYDGVTPFPAVSIWSFDPDLPYDSFEKIESPYRLGIRLKIENLLAGADDCAPVGMQNVYFYSEDTAELEALAAELTGGTRAIMRLQSSYQQGTGAYAYYLVPAVGDEYFVELEPGVEPDFSSAGLADVAEAMELVDVNARTAALWTTKDMTAIPGFEAQYVVTEGRALDHADETKKNSVCVIRQELAATRGLEVGDTIDITLRKLSQASGSIRPGMEETPWQEAESCTRTLTIVGLLTAVDPALEYSGYYSYIYVPDWVVPQGYETTGDMVVADYTSFVLKDIAEQEEFVLSASDAFEAEGYSLYFVPTGYAAFAATAEPLMRSAGTNTAVLTAVGALAFALSFLLYFFFRRKELPIMLALGVPRRTAVRAALEPAALLYGAGLTIAGVGAYIDGRGKAEAALAGLSGEYVFEVDFSLFEMLLFVVIAWAAATGLTALALDRMSRRPVLEQLGSGGRRAAAENAVKMDPSAVSASPAASTVHVPAAAAPERRGRFPAWGLRYLVRRLVRTPVKGLLAALVAAGLLFGLGALRGGITTGEAEVDALYSSVQVGGSVIRSMSLGSSAGDGYLPVSAAEELQEIGNLNNVIREAGCTVSAARRPNEPGEKSQNLALLGVERPETFAPLSNGTLEVTYAGDMTEADFFSNADGEPEVLVSEDLLGKLGLSVGGRIFVLWGDRGESLNIAGSFPGGEDGTGVDLIMSYAALESLYDTELSKYGQELMLRRFEFQVDKSLNRSITEVRTASQAVLDGAGSKGEMFLLLDDGELTEVVRPMERNLGLMRLLYPGLRLLSVALSALAAALMVLRSAKEASLLRVLGVRKGGAASLLVLEQLIPALTGALLGAVVLALLRIGGVVWPEVWQNEVFYALGALAGAAASALVRVRKNPLELLQVKE